MISRHARLRKIADYFVPTAFSRDTDAYRRAELCVGIALSLLPFMFVRAALIAKGGLGTQALLVGALVVCVAGSLLLLKRTASLVAAGNVLVLALFGVGSSMAYLRGGVGSPPLVALAALPLIATFIAGPRSGVFWGAMVCVEALGFAGLKAFLGFAPADHLAQGSKLGIETGGVLLFTMTMVAVSIAFEWTKSLALEARAQAERNRLLAEEDARMLQADRMASVGQLGAGVAHEINNPLAYIAANLDFIEREIARLRASEPSLVNRELSDAVAESRVGIERVSLIVRDLKTFARDDDGQTGPVDLREVCDASIRIVDNEIRHRARLEKHYPAEPTVVRANETRLVQVLLNLLINAAQAVPAGQADQNLIRVSISKHDATVEVEITDTGAGMTPEVLASATRPFFTTKPVGVGTGLGLAVCDNVVRALGGTFHIESEVGHGCTVRVMLPLALEQQLGPARAAQSARPSEAELKVLLIDDDPLVIRALGRLLRHHSVTAKVSGREALSLLETGERFDVILCDLMMPDLTGADVYERVAELGQGLERRMVFLTGGAFTEPVRRFLERVPNPRFEKPIRADNVDAILRSARTAA